VFRIVEVSNSNLRLQTGYSRELICISLSIQASVRMNNLSHEDQNCIRV